MRYLKTNMFDNSYDPAGVANVIFNKLNTRATINTDRNMTETERRTVGFELKNMLIQCIFNLKECSEDDFDYYYDPYYGNCYTFNKGISQNGTTENVKKLGIAD
jgi:hypothetical protein